MLFAAQIVLLVGINNTYLTDIIEKKIIGFFSIAVGQTAPNIAAALNGYEEAVNQMTIDERFLDQTGRFEKAQGQMELSVEQELRKQMRTHMSYRPQVWCMVVEIEDGKISSLDRLQIDSLY